MVVVAVAVVAAPAVGPRWRGSKAAAPDSRPRSISASSKPDIYRPFAKHSPQVSPAMPSTPPPAAMRALPRRRRGARSHPLRPRSLHRTFFRRSRLSSPSRRQLGNHINDTGNAPAPAALFDPWNRPPKIDDSRRNGGGTLTRRAVKMFPRCPAVPSISR